MKLLVLGANGLLGRHVCAELVRKNIPFESLSHAQLDITDNKGCIATLDRTSPTTVINCAALCDFSACENNPARSRAINRDAPVSWARECASRHITFCHFSSDYIFDGKQQTPYTEDSTPNPLCVYGRHKAETEEILTKLPNQLLLRVSWLFGADGHTFMSMLPELLRTREKITVASGKKGACLYVGYAAEIIVKLVEHGSTGTFNLAHLGETSWEAFATATLHELSERDLSPQCRTIIEQHYSQIPGLSANRPVYSVLATDKLATELGQPVMPWRTGLTTFLDALYPVHTS